MSKIISIQTELRDREVLQDCLEQLHCQVLHQPEGISLKGSQKPVQLLAHASFGSIGFRLTASGTYEMVGDDMILDRQQEFLNTLKQQYAYRKILKDSNAAGYNLVQEEVGDDNTITLVVRKW